MARSSLNPFSITVLILLVMATLVFTLLFVMSSNSVTKTLEGSAEDSERKQKFDDVARELRELEGRVEVAQDAITVRQREINRLEVDLTKFRVFHTGDQILASFQGEDLTYAGKPYKAKQSNWVMAREYIAQVNARLKSHRDEHESPARQENPALQEQIDQRAKEQQAVLAKASEMDKQFKEDEEKLTALKDELEKKKAEVEKQRRNDYGVGASDINKKEDSIRTLLELKLRWLKELEADGQILQVASHNHFVVINIGKRDRVFPGLILEVFQHEQGRYVEKGRLEVIDVQDQVSSCRITRELKPNERPISIGDFVANPVFDVKATKVFVLAGEFKQFNTDNLASFIRASGGEVREKLSPGVDFLIAGDRSDRQQDAAREYQVQAMTEAQLLMYVQPAF